MGEDDNKCSSCGGETCSECGECKSCGSGKCE